MHCEHSAYTNPTCALLAPFVSHTLHFCFDLWRAKEMNAPTPSEQNGDNPIVLTKQPPRTQCMRVTLTWLRAGLSDCSVVLCSVPYLFLKYINFLMQLCKKCLLKTLKTTAHTFFLRSRLRLRSFFWECAPVALVFNFMFQSGNDDF